MDSHVGRHCARGMYDVGGRASRLCGLAGS